MHEMGDGTGTITLSGETYRRVVYDIGKSLIYHGFNKIVFVTHHGSNSKVVDEVLRRIRYESGAFTCWYKTPTEREYNALKGIIEGPPEETPGWHSGEIETSTCLAYDETWVDMSRAVKDRTHAPKWMGPAFSKKDGSGMVEFMETEQAWVPMEHHEYSETSTIGNPVPGDQGEGAQILRPQCRAPGSLPGRGEKIRHPGDQPGVQQPGMNLKREAIPSFATATKREF